jgi:hypothetical protein
MNRITLLTLVVLIVGAGETRAQMVTVLGVGNKSCGAWIAARRANDATAYTLQGWVAGFLSGSNSIIASNPAYGIDTLKEVAQGDAQGLWTWVDNYCQAHPLNSVATAADALGGELIRRAGGAAH